MDKEVAKNKLAEAYAAVQNLQIQPTKTNIELLTIIMRNLDETFAMIEQEVSDGNSEVR